MPRHGQAAGLLLNGDALGTDHGARLAMVTLSGSVLADQYVSSYYRKDGTYVQGHTKGSPDEYRYNNKSSQSNGGSQRDEYSSGGGATNRSNAGYGVYDNDRDGVSNSYDRKPESKRSW